MTYRPQIVDIDFTEAGHSVRRPEIPRSWLSEYVAALLGVGVDALPAGKADGIVVVPAALLGP